MTMIFEVYIEEIMRYMDDETYDWNKFYMDILKGLKENRITAKEFKFLSFYYKNLGRKKTGGMNNESD